MISIQIQEESETKEGMTIVLEEVIKQIRSGNTSGIGPDWYIEGEEEKENNN